MVFSSDDVTPVTTRLVEVAVPTTVSPLVNVEEAARRPALKVSVVEVALLGNGYAIALVITPVEEL